MSGEFQTRFLSMPISHPLLMGGNSAAFRIVAFTSVAEAAESIWGGSTDTNIPDAIIALKILLRGRQVVPGEVEARAHPVDVQRECAQPPGCGRDRLPELVAVEFGRFG